LTSDASDRASPTECAGFKEPFHPAQYTYGYA
jgi:hypothetical protein